MKLLLDMNIPLKYASLLEKRGFKPIFWSDVGSPSAADAEITDYARRNNYVVLTYDLDFSAILSVTHEQKPSVIQIRASVVQAEIAADLIASALFQNANAMENGAIMSIGLKKSRLRLLPL